MHETSQKSKRISGGGKVKDTHGGSQLGVLTNAPLNEAYYKLLSNLHTSEIGRARRGANLHIAGLQLRDDSPVYHYALLG